MRNVLTVIAVISLITYRVARFLILDTLIDTPRIWFHQVILAKPKPWRMKLYELITCPFCLTVWVAAAVTAIGDLTYGFTAPVAVWLASAAGSLMVWNIVED